MPHLTRSRRRDRRQRAIGNPPRSGVTMANETVLAALNSDAAEAVFAQYLLLLADRNFIGNLPTLHYAGSCNDRFSNVVSVPAYGLMGYDSAASTAEASAASNTVLTDAKYQITVSKYTHVLQPSDISKMILGATGVLDPAVLAMNAAAIGAAKLSDLLCDVIDGFTATAGPGSGIDADIPSLLAAVGKMGTLNVDKSRGFTGVLHGQQWSDILVDAATTGGAIQFTFQNEASGLLQLSPGAKGRWAGIDWFETNRVVTASKVVGVVRVQTLHALARSGDSAA
ncbi:MAG: hypothetical protein ABMA64_24435, partial [Myxococcota bacterium]